MTPPPCFNIFLLFFYTEYFYLTFYAQRLKEIIFLPINNSTKRFINKLFKEAKNAEGGKRKKVQKKSNSGAPFSWQSNYVRKFDFKIYFLCQVSTNYPDGIYKSTSHGEDLKNMKLNKNTRYVMI